MNIKSLVIALVLISLACQSKKPVDQVHADSTIIPSVPLPPAAMLTEQQSADGWKLLFNGQSLDGWRFFKDQPNNSWEVVDGALHCKPFTDGEENLRADLMTVDQFENFELSIDWKISPQGNSGIMYRVNEDYDQPYKTGPEYQVLDDGGYPGESKATNMSAGVYDMFEVPHKKLNPPGEWNTTKIIAKGSQIEHWLNGEKVLAYEIGSADWKKRKANSKWKDEPGYGIPKKGHIDLQDHSHEVWFRNVMIRTF